jgi:hypothetical protein
VSKAGLARLEELAIEGVVSASLTMDVTVRTGTRRDKKRDTIRKGHDHVALY